MMKKLMFLLLCFSMNSFALEIDEKLTTRVVGLSVSKKTILINRGIEDGLAVGDHAKFYVSVGVVARGVIIKTSPARSVWSLYRLVNKDYIREAQVLKLKITPAVKITKDESRTFVTDDSGNGVVRTGDPRDLGIPLAEGADDISAGSSSQTNQELVNEFTSSSSSKSLVQKNIELYGTLSFDSRSQNFTTDVENSESFDSNISSLYLRIGGEYYLNNEQKWYSRISLLGQISLSKTAVTITDGSLSEESSTEFGFGVNIHPLAKPFQSEKFIPYLNYTVNFGSSNIKFTDGVDDTNNSTLNASIFAHNFGGGVKYYTFRGIGLRAEVSFIIRQDTFEADENNVILTKTGTGPRIAMGMSYRF